MKLYRIFISLLPFLLAGCGRESAPPPPTIRSDLVLGLYNSIDNRRHEVALRKIERLREIEPSNVFLANLETLERNNSILFQAQKRINAGDLKGALAQVSDGIRKYGRHAELMAAEKKLKIANRINKLLAVFGHPRNSATLTAAAMQLEKIAENYKPADIFLPLAKRKLEEAKVLSAWEEKRAVDGLCSQIASMLKENAPDVEVLYAVLEIADPDNDVLLEYRKFISGKGPTSLSVFKEENIFDNPNAASEEHDSDEERSETDRNDEKGGRDSEEKKSDEKKETNEWWKKFSF